MRHGPFPALEIDPYVDLSGKSRTVGSRRADRLDGLPAHAHPGGCLEARDGYHAALAEAGLPTFDDLVVWTSFTREGGRAGAARLLAATPPPEAVVCANDLIAIGALDIAREHALAAPQDMAITGYDDIEAASLVSPALTTVLNPAREIGRTAAQLLLDRLASAADTYAREVVLSHRLVIREST
ncbi:substrate-binding domain-containing protein [Streptomyces sp. NPDC051322]|uniref:LacI family DNA-binding transcriptional regulator n=1 Tax=Streptomyces sp. NPDC051322 TaxID=3154645 RepID=UPI00344C6852